jgi:anthranilate synthase/aminodeoxychorismate synthase-like glutamine amidotransferase
MQNLVLIIDNYDSFTYNIVQYIGEFNQNIKVFRNDKITLDEIEELLPYRIIISPGPGNPSCAGISKKLIERFKEKIPILGICLGHQCIGEVFGAKIIKSTKIYHGKTSLIFHDNKTIYKNLPNPFIATRYHSLIIEKSSVNDNLVISAETEDKIIMGIRHKNYKIEGVQFHPESILTEYGKKIITNFLD